MFWLDTWGAALHYHFIAGIHPHSRNSLDGLYTRMKIGDLA